MKHGGTRKGAGRKPSLNKKLKVDLYIETSIINDLGGIENAKLKLYNFAKIDAGGEIIKTVDNVVRSIKSEENAISHFVSVSVCENCGEHKAMYCEICLESFESQAAQTN